mmetsp:Transcript_11697/g.19579  ORF Transcript_11697/g.19579 Transcript_11697/m.19579 type:complete len:306 (-) Transcript_11697:155-1072(-)
MFDEYYRLLPPHWCEVEMEDGSISYRNDITQEETAEHPFVTFIQMRKQMMDEANSDDLMFSLEAALAEKHSSNDLSRTPDTDPVNGIENTANGVSTPKTIVAVGDTPSPSSPAQQVVNENKNSSDPLQTQPLEGLAELNFPSGKYFDYHCQWSERDLFGKVNLYGLTLRYYYEDNERRTLVKFDGLVGEWVYSKLDGAYGPLCEYDFYIGAKVCVFGRHLTISSASGSAIRWIENEKKRLEKQQNYYRDRIFAVGSVPCVKGKDAMAVRHITRDRAPGKVDVRRMLMDTTRLGEQFASLGLAQGI